MKRQEKHIKLPHTNNEVTKPLPDYERKQCTEKLTMM